MNKTVVIGITSGIAAYKVLDLIKLLKKEGIDVHVIMTKSAMKMVSSTEFEEVSGNKVNSELFEKDFDYKKILKKRAVDHIELADKADIMVIIPATANTIAKITSGIADDFLTTTLLAITAPVIICPSMNVHMWHNPLVLQNVQKLKSQGYQIINPINGELACGYEGMGRLEDIKIVYQEILKQLQRTDSLKGRKILVTAGGTKEKIDDVRYIANRSSGKMGVAIAEECYLRGGEVLLLRAKNSVIPRYPIRQLEFESSGDLSDLIDKNLKSAYIIFHAAAVADFSTRPVTGKILSSTPLSLKLEENPKILDRIKKINQKIFVVGFKAVYSSYKTEIINEAKKILRTSNSNLIVANDVSQSDRGFEAETNEVYLVTKNHEIKLTLDSKRNIAVKLVDFVVDRARGGL